MKIVDLKTFCQLPPGTVFAKYEPCIFEPLQIKHESIYETLDFFYSGIHDAVDNEGSGDFVDKCILAESGEEVAMDFDDNVQSDGLFEKEQLFAVWAKQDVTKLIDRLQRAQAEAERRGRWNGVL